MLNKNLFCILASILLIIVIIYLYFTITDTDNGYSYQDTLQFGAGISASSVRVSRVGNDMVFTISDTDQVTVKDWYKSSYYYIEKITFVKKDSFGNDRCAGGNIYFSRYYPLLVQH